MASTSENMNNTYNNIQDMDNRRSRKLIAEETLDVIRTGRFCLPDGRKINISDLIATSVDDTRVYSPERLLRLSQDYDLSRVPSDSKTHFEVTGETSLSAARRLVRHGYPNACVLNFASGKNPGGGFLKGSQAQEESLARSSSLYHNLTEKGNDFYTANRQARAPFYTHHMVWCPKVPVFRNDVTNLTIENFYTVDMITAPAVNAGWAEKSGTGSREEIRATQLARIDRLFALALYKGVETMVLGAWGCGVFGHTASEMAAYFHELLTGKFEDAFKHVVFAIHYTSDTRNIDAFRTLFAPGEEEEEENRKTPNDSHE